MTETQAPLKSEGGHITTISRGNVMVVDDEPANLKLMEHMLLNEGYSVRSLPHGRLALIAVGRAAPDLILLDINMPEIDGYEVCTRLKADRKLASIPVIFLSALNETEDKVRAFRTGAVDYITKPFRFEEVQARVETHLGLQRARRAERDLLENTLNGVVRTLADLIHFSGPALAARSDAIRNIVLHLTARMELEDSWQYELGAILCLIGCVALPAEVFERAYSRAPRASDEEMFRAHPESGARLLAKIPRLEIVSEMIRRQQTAGGDALQDDAAELGACLLHVAVELDRWMFRGLSVEAALGQLKTVPQGFRRGFLEMLEDYSPLRATFDVKSLAAQDLRVSMVAEDDIVTKDGNLIIARKGATLNATAIERIRNFDRTRGICQPIRVHVPQSGRN